MVKQRKDSHSQYVSAGRDDLAANEAQGIEVIESFLPKKLSEDEVKDLVTSLMSQAMILKVPLIAEANYGQNWLEAH